MLTNSCGETMQKICLAVFCLVVDVDLNIRISGFIGDVQGQVFDDFTQNREFETRT